MPTVEVLFDPREVLAMQGFPLDPDRHEVLPTCDWLASAMCHCKREDIFIYRHKVHGTFCLCQWVIAPGEGGTPVILELFQQENSPGWAPSEWPSLEAVRQRLMPAHAQARGFMRRQREKAWEKRADLEEQSDLRKDKSRYLKRRGLDQAANRMGQGCAPLGKQDTLMKELTAQTTDELNRMAKR